MFDPLTAATLTPDQIVSLCDELIAAHGFVKDGGSLPDLDAKRTRVPISGKTFGRVDAKVLRKSWDDAQAKAGADYIQQWQIIGPFLSPEPNQISLALRAPVEDDYARRSDGTIDPKVTFKAGDQTLRWKPAAVSSKSGLVNLAREIGPFEYCAAYAYAEVESIHPRETVLRCGSDDGIQIWLNGQVVHQNDTTRGYHAGDDEAPIHLRAGVNRILVKITNGASAWGFGVAVPRATS